MQLCRGIARATCIANYKQVFVALHPVAAAAAQALFPAYHTRAEVVRAILLFVHDLVEAQVRAARADGRWRARSLARASLARSRC